MHESEKQPKARSMETAKGMESERRESDEWPEKGEGIEPKNTQRPR